PAPRAAGLPRLPTWVGRGRPRGAVPVLSTTAPGTASLKYASSGVARPGRLTAGAVPLTWDDSGNCAMRLSEVIPLAEAALHHRSALAPLWDALQEPLPERLAAGLSLGTYDQGSLHHAATNPSWPEPFPAIARENVSRALHRLLARLRSTVSGVSTD